MSDGWCLMFDVWLQFYRKYTFNCSVWFFAFGWISTLALFCGLNVCDNSSTPATGIVCAFQLQLLTHTSCPLLVRCHWLFVHLFAVCCLLSAVCCLLSAVRLALSDSDTWDEHDCIPASSGVTGLCAEISWLSLAALRQFRPETLPSITGTMVSVSLKPRSAQHNSSRILTTYPRHPI